MEFQGDSLKNCFEGLIVTKIDQDSKLKNKLKNKDIIIQINNENLLNFTHKLGQR